MKENIRFVVFDLGGVLVRITPEKFYMRMFRRAPALLATMEKVQKDLQTGLESPQSLFRKLIRRHGLALDTGTVLRIFKKDYIGTPIRSMLRLLNALKKEGYKLCLLSNTNSVHFNHIRPMLDGYRSFYRLYPSHILHLIKPGKGIFRFLLKDLKAAPREILYIDDTQENIDTARSLDMNVLKVRMNRPDAGKIVKKLKQLNA